MSLLRRSPAKVLDLAPYETRRRAQIALLTQLELAACEKLTDETDARQARILLVLRDYAREERGKVT